jgi:hypothetical protein
MSDNFEATFRLKVTGRDAQIMKEFLDLCVRNMGVQVAEEALRLTKMINEQLAEQIERLAPVEEVEEEKEAA